MNPNVAAAGLSLLLVMALLWGARNYLSLVKLRRRERAEAALRAEIRETILSSLNQESILSRITILLHDHLGFERVWLGTIGEGRLVGRMARGWSLERDFLFQPLPLSPPEPNPWCDAAREGKVVAGRGPGDERYGSFLAITGGAPFITMPLTIRNKVVGVIYVDSGEKDKPLPENSRYALEEIAQEVGIALENARLYEREQNFARELKQEVDRVTRNLSQAQEKLVRTERLAATGRLAAQIAHEINNPLGGIKNYLYLLNNRLKDEKCREMAGIITSEVDRISRIVRQLLDFYRPPGEDMVPTDLNRVATEAAALVEKDLETRGIELEIDLDESLPKARAAGEQIKQVILNLLLNARDVMPRGGELHLATGRVKDEDGEWVLVSVADTGPGIEPENMSAIFE
ncbi:MAG: GAF domain-containing protein, partial [Deltaproteobacteria bacterium]|nr:GAF domain-containing protein [Deltaproteobacteria bacterium]